MFFFLSNPQPIATTLVSFCLRDCFFEPPASPLSKNVSILSNLPPPKVLRHFLTLLPLPILLIKQKKSEKKMEKVEKIWKINIKSEEIRKKTRQKGQKFCDFLNTKHLKGNVKIS